ncbi:MAG: acetyltransferase [Candidatus Omnitrophota bacterium]
MKKKIILIGGGGHCKSCIDIIEAEGNFQIAGIVDFKEKLHSSIMGYEVLACDNELEKLNSRGVHFLIAIGHLKSTAKRIEKFEFLENLKAKFPLIISPDACISKHANLGYGTIVMHKASVNAGANIGKNCIINTGSIIEHDVLIGDHCHISTGVVINGECRIGKGTFVGSNAVIANNINIAENVVIGAGAVVVHSIDSVGTYVGVPARKLKNNE